MKFTLSLESPISLEELVDVLNETLNVSFHFVNDEENEATYFLAQTLGHDLKLVQRDPGESSNRFLLSCWPSDLLHHLMDEDDPIGDNSDLFVRYLKHLSKQNWVVASRSANRR